MEKLRTHRFHTDLDMPIAANAGMTRLAAGFTFCEGPVWDPRKKLLYFTDFYALRIHIWSPRTGVSLYCDESGREIGLALDRQGRLLGCASRLHAISCREEDGSVHIYPNRLADGTRLNSPNDLAVKSDSSVYFTDFYNPNSGLPRSSPVNAVYRLEPEKGTLVQATPPMEHPNGLCFSPDEKFLYVNDTDGQSIDRYTVCADGSLTERQRFAVLDPSFGKGAPDGMKCDKLGNVYVTGPGGIWIFSPGGTALGILYTDEYAGNFAFGGSSGDDLFITASHSLYFIPSQPQAK